MGFDFGVGYSELFVLAVLAVIVIGPKDLPHVLRGFGRMMNKARSMAREFQGHVDQAMRETGASEIKKEFEAAKSSFTSVMNTPQVTSPLEATRKSEGAKSFETYFGASPSKGEVRVAGKPVEESI